MTRWLRWLLLAVALAAVLLQFLRPERAGGFIELTRAGFVQSDAPRPPGTGTRWLERSLPDDWNRSNPGQSGFGWYRMSFELPQAPPDAWMAYLPTVATTHQLFVNGVAVGGGAMSGPFERSLGRPHAHGIAPQLLRAGSNEVFVRLRVAPNLRGGLGPIMLGPQRVVAPLYERDVWARVTIPRSLNLALVFVGLLVLLLWLRRPTESIHGIFAALALVWSVRNFHYTAATTPLPSSLWEAFVLGSLGVVVVLQWIFLRRYTALAPRPLERWLLAAALLSVPVFALLDPAVVKSLRVPWYALCAGMGVWTIALLVRRLRQSPPGEQSGPWVIFGAMLVTLLLGIADLAVSAQLLPFGPAARMAYGAPLLLCALVYALAESFYRTYDQARALNADLERRVHERTSELESTHARLRGMEREATLSAERERLMRDMHDGIGSQLMTTLDAVRRGTADLAEVEKLLRECIDDLRLMIDSLEPQQHSLQIALGNLRYRLEPRLRAAGVQLAWQVDDCAALPSASAALQVLRIVQEAVNNVLKHAGATSLRIACRCEAGQLVLEVADNGRGLARRNDGDAPAPARRGLGNMRMRAQQLHGTLDIAGRGEGTRLTLRVPLAVPPPAASSANTPFSG